jgi:hypothetical protein
MGLLDDAIREHLDLKRRRGADPAEVERAQREALGPVRRGPEDADAGDPAFEDEPGAEDELEYEYEYEQGTEPEWKYEPEAEEAPREPAPARVPPVDAPGPAEPDPLGDPFADDDDDSFAEPEKPDARGTDPKLEHGSGTAGEQTVEYNVEEALKSEPGQEGEDPLEETPEFLQDAPEHDRLWFEQRPPRDFDFDG